MARWSGLVCALALGAAACESPEGAQSLSDAGSPIEVSDAAMPADEDAGPRGACGGLDCEPGFVCQKSDLDQASCVAVPDAGRDEDAGVEPVQPGACSEPVIDCAAPPDDCNYVGGGCVDGAWTCGELVCAPSETCDLVCEFGQRCALVPVQCLIAPCPEIARCIDDASCTGPVIDCAAPPDGCNYVGGGCVDGAWTCGELTCAPVEACDPVCEPGSHCESVEVQCFFAPCPVRHRCVPDAP